MLTCTRHCAIRLPDRPGRAVATSDARREFLVNSDSGTNLASRFTPTNASATFLVLSVTPRSVLQLRGWPPGRGNSDTSILCERPMRDSSWPELTHFAMRFDGKLLQRGFWLYGWHITRPDGEWLYVGRTGDSSSAKAGSPFGRVAQHLDTRLTAKGNSMARQLKTLGIAPAECTFEVTAVGPILPEPACIEDHRPLRNTVAAVEKALAAHLRVRGSTVIGHHASRGTINDG